MCPPSTVRTDNIVLSTDNIGLCWTDEQICLTLNQIVRGSPLPSDVIDENPFQYSPLHLPDGLWYFFLSTKNKETEHGFWKAKGEACEVFANSSLSGWRTTLEYFEGKAPFEKMTNWVMQEYKITMLEGKNIKEPEALCRVFRCSGLSSNDEIHQKNGEGNHNLAETSIVPRTSSTSVEGCTGDTQIKGSLVVDKDPDPAGFDFSDGDFLELNDLVDPGSSSSSSPNSSRLSFSSDECFDPEALLRELDAESNKNDMQGRDMNSKFNITPSVRPDRVVMQLARSGSVISETEIKSPPEDTLPSSSTKEKYPENRHSANAVRSQKADYTNGGGSCSGCSFVASSSNLRPGRRAENKPVTRLRKLKNKYLCCLPL